MNKKISKFIEKITAREDFIFFVVTAMYFVMYFFVPAYGDDIELAAQYQNLTLADHWDLIVYDYLYWSSRVLVNAVVHVILGYHKIVWIIMNTLMVFILLKSLSKLFAKNNKREINIFISAIVMLYPVFHMGTAGWITTGTTYFWPIAIGFAALIPIRKIIDNETFKKWEYPLYALALIYAANEELMMVVLLFTYAAFLIYFIGVKKIKKYYIVQFLLAAGSFVFTMTAPGNSSRGDQEVGHWFKDYESLDFLDKVDIGVTSAIHEIVYGSYGFFIIACLLVSFVVWKMYNDKIIRLAGLVPSAVVIMFGPLKDITAFVFPYTAGVIAGVERTGYITTQNYDSVERMVTLMLMVVVCAIFTVSLYLIFRNTWSSLFAITLLAAGTASRIAIGFSPTIWVSSYRTYSAMFFAVIAVGVMIFAKSMEEKMFSQKQRAAIEYINYILIFVGFINSWISIVN